MFDWFTPLVEEEEEEQFGIRDVVKAVLVGVAIALVVGFLFR